MFYIWTSYRSPYWSVWQMTDKDQTPTVVHQCDTKRQANRWKVNYANGLQYLDGGK